MPEESLKQKCANISDSSKEQFLSTNTDFLTEIGSNVTNALNVAQSLMTQDQKNTLLTNDDVARFSNVREWQVTGQFKPGEAQFPLTVKVNDVIAQLNQDSSENPAENQIINE